LISWCPQRSLSHKNILKIVDIRLREIEQRLADKKMTLDVEGAAKQHLMSAGYSPTYGARPLNRVIQSEMLNPLSVMLLSDRIREGETIRVRFDGPRNRLQILPNHEVSGGVDEMDIDDDDIEIEEMD
jgi:ATP-dependent Clp protease ATP-binding subunit ClpB